MSSNPVSWGEVLRRRQQSKLESKLESNPIDTKADTKVDTKDKEEEVPSDDLVNENEAPANNSNEAGGSDNSLFTMPDFMFRGGGNTVVCQVLSSV